VIGALREHWPEYLIEGALLGMFMVSAGTLAVLIEYPGSPVRAALADPLLRRAVRGFGIGLTALALIYSPWGQRSGAHMNPAVTLTFLRLGKIHARDAVFYMIAQVVGGTLGVIMVLLVLRSSFAEPPVSYIVTVPGPQGPGVALVGEFLISILLMLVILTASNTRSLSRWVGFLAGMLLWLYITIEAPLSGMSLNPARSFASALSSGTWTAFWVYLLGPPLAMLAAAEIYGLVRGRRRVYCAKLNHHGDQRCIFVCRYHDMLHE
jgi:aquaporin Z